MAVWSLIMKCLSRYAVVPVFILSVALVTGAQASRLHIKRIATETVALQSAASVTHEYLWYEAENMRGITANAQNEPQLNPSWIQLPASKAPGWGINGPGVSAEWTQGGESEWNSVNASADETRGTISQDIEVPRAGDYKVWVRYADWAAKTEIFTVTISQNDREVFTHDFGAQDIVDSHDEIEMYWQWAFAW